MLIGYTDQEINRMTFTKWCEYIQLIKNIRLILYNVFIHMMGRYKKQAFYIWKHYGKMYYISVYYTIQYIILFSLCI